MLEEDVNVKTVDMQKGTGQGPPFGTGWTYGRSRFARSCPEGKSKGQNWPGKGEEKGKGKGKLIGPMFGSCISCGGKHFSSECPTGDHFQDASKNSGTATTCCSGGGHRAAQCSTSARETEYDEEEEDHGDVENVSEGWDILVWRRAGGSSGVITGMVALGGLSDCGPRWVIFNS